MPDLTRNPWLRTQAYVAGAWRDAASGRTFNVVDPASGAKLTHAPMMGGAEARDAIDAAHAALPDWRERTAGERAGVLRRWADLMSAHEEDLAALLTAEQGKPLAEARAEIAYAASFLTWFAEEARRTYGEVIPTDQPGRRLFTVKRPCGVVAAITPWNFPAAMITRKAGPALAAGCTMVVKPSEETPLTALALAALAEAAGAPGGVFNVVTGDPIAIGAEFTANPRVAKITFTGSTRVGKLLLAQSADTVKRVSLELGGNAPFIVFDDADLDVAIAAAMAAKFRNSGQTCVCADRFYVQRAIHDAFVAGLAAAMAGLTLGAGAEAGVTQGPLINAAARRKVEALLADACAAGARIVVGGPEPAVGPLFFRPTLVCDARNDMALVREETFGPVAAIVPFDSEDEVLALANDTRAGLAGYVCTKDSARIWRMTEQLEVGMVGVNTGLISTAVAPFGGMKESGLGREGGRQGIEDYLEIKYACQAI